MRRIRSAMRKVSLLLLAAFIGLGGWFGYTVYSQGSRWTTSTLNNRITYAKRDTGMGDITDRNGVMLARTDENGARQYNADEAVRRAVSQTVGDQLSMSGTGVETFHAGTLLGFSGSIIDRTWQYISGGDYRGDNIRLTIDSTLSAYASSVFPGKYLGAVAVVNYKTGEILCMVSKPDYDPQALANRQEGADESGSGYLNRCLQGQYAPGSIFKVVTLTAALKNLPGVVNRSFSCEASRQFGNGKVTCFGGTAHGDMTLLQAFGKSCNVTFASLAYEMGAGALIETAQDMGFNDNFNFRDLVLYESTIPETIQDASELAWTGVGQGKLLVTPLHMAMIAGAIGNGGVMEEPELISQVTGVGGIARIRVAAGDYKRVMSGQIAATVGEYMRQTVAYGTAKKAAVDGYTVCGKTGSAEISDDKSVQTNAWFIGYVADDKHPYAIAVVVEQAGTGGDKAAPIAAKVLKKAIALGA